MKKIYILILILFLLTVSIFAAGIYFLGDFSFGNKIAIVYLNGPIYYDYSEDNSIFPTEKKDARYYIKLLNKLREDNSVKGVLLVVNSPGGEVVASEDLANAVKKLREKKPVVVYVETLDASGAYMVSAPANYIVAHRDSIVGSIGVRMDIVHYYGLMKKLGINVTVIKAGKYKDIGSPYRPMTPEEKRYLQKLINETYIYFVKWVAENRNLSLNYTFEIADGKIYSGEDAVKVGLVDEVGDKEKALKILEKLANVSNPSIEEYGLESSSGLFGLKTLMYYLGLGIGNGIGEVLVKNEKIRLY
ncbi:signal peptide peptidase SppA [Methanocaldococcus indicus]|uniref:signal peptide peptidase SppA n=1 Tax=Methanocaldococcus indicus TaxID=213231 RepID=UPI003C6D2E9C